MFDRLLDWQFRVPDLDPIDDYIEELIHLIGHGRRVAQIESRRRDDGLAAPGERTVPRKSSLRD